MVAGGDGNYYGVTLEGGAADGGTLFRLTPAGEMVRLVDFPASQSGGAPRGPLVQGSDGKLYGVTTGGSYGTVFRVSLSGQLETLVVFTGQTGSFKGSAPAGLVKASNGDLIGTTSGGGAGNRGTIFRLTAGGAFTTLYEFPATSSLLSGPLAALVEHPNGDFYGTTPDTGALGYGTVFRMTSAGAVTTLVDFTYNGASNKGSRPRAALLVGGDGNLYGTTQYGGVGFYGTVFRMTPAGALTTLTQFTGSGATPGRYPFAALVLAADGNYYGSTAGGTVPALGTIFRVSAGGIVSNVFEFTGDNGPYPGSAATGLLALADGRILGLAAGFTRSFGGVFELASNGSYSKVLELAHTDGPLKGSYPQARLLADGEGNLYGTTSEGGLGYGTVFRLSEAGNLTTLASFSKVPGGSMGQYPRGGLVVGADGQYYGSTAEGGSSNFGTVYRLTSGGLLETIVRFTSNGASNKGASPSGELVLLPSGDFYGSTSSGGSGNYGTLFQMSPAGSLTTLVEFTSNGPTNKGAYPPSAPILAADGSYYGTTAGGGSASYGTVFRFSAGVLTTLVEFTNNSIRPGGYPNAPLAVGPDGHFYGTTRSGLGTMFRLTAGGTFTNTYTYSDSLTTGFGPVGLTLCPDGKFYGATQLGGASGGGTLFRVAPGGAPTTLVHLQSASTGSQTVSGLVASRDGNLYGVTRLGGSGGGGTVFRLRFGPTVVTDPMPATSEGTATLTGTINPNSANSTAQFELGLSPGDLNESTPPQVMGAGSTVLAVTAQVSGLQGGTTYYYRLRGDNSEQFQPQRGQIYSFTTPLPNHAPSAGNDYLSCSRNTQVMFTVAQLLANDSDPDGDPLVLQAISNQTTQGGVVFQNGNSLTYVPPVGFAGDDSFTYSVQDGRGGVSSAVVNVAVAPVGLSSATNLIGITRGPAELEVRWQGISGRSYRVEQTDALTGSWVAIGGSILADANGLVQFVDSQPVPQRFYRIVTP